MLSISEICRSQSKRRWFQFQTLMFINSVHCFKKTGVSRWVLCQLERSPSSAFAWQTARWSLSYWFNSSGEGQVPRIVDKTSRSWSCSSAERLGGELQMFLFIWKLSDITSIPVKSYEHIPQKSERINSYGHLWGISITGNISDIKRFQYDVRKRVAWEISERELLCLWRAFQRQLVKRSRE